MLLDTRRRDFGPHRRGRSGGIICRGYGPKHLQSRETRRDANVWKPGRSLREMSVWYEESPIEGFAFLFGESFRPWARAAFLSLFNLGRFS